MLGVWEGMWYHQSSGEASQGSEAGTEVLRKGCREWGKEGGQRVDASCIF